MEQKFIDLFDRYTHGGMNRRDFLERLTALRSVRLLGPLVPDDAMRARLLVRKQDRRIS